MPERRQLFGDTAIMGGLANRSGVMADGTIDELKAAVKDLIDGEAVVGKLSDMRRLLYR